MKGKHLFVSREDQVHFIIMTLNDRTKSMFPQSQGIIRLYNPETLPGAFMT